ncbi:hypothetical protein BU202_03085 [Streptococcus cuniculi]|uniref:Uncharacterized protein n=1 Tax=Streptococcus cuniculi TaxID=1432788 RepID=A0A1Q8E9Z5_9STRE|nr:hypothetical protein [Streptococcus cuniculi]OLF48618.1 hypothetical protein BU202_03085 [Streptococcus cuniculi]
MFGKLLKYEFKAVGKWYLGLYAAAGLLSVIIGLWIQNIMSRASIEGISNYSNGYQFAQSVEAIFFVAIMVGLALIIAGLFLSTFFLIVNRFRKNVYGRQGYLTMTLPVTNHQIILSKLTAGFVWSCLSSIATVLCLFIITFIAVVPNTELSMGEVFLAINEAFKELTGLNFFIYYGFLLMISTVHSILLIYFAISLGQLFKDHRTLLAVVFYFGINFVEGILTSILLATSGTFSTLGNIYNGGTFDAYYIYSLILSILLASGYYFGTHYIMTKKLNLQ